MDGELVFWSVNVADVPRGRRFFGELLGWTYSTPGPTGAVVIEGRRAAFHPLGHGDPQAVSLRVGDMGATVARIVELGGAATEPLPTAYGAHSVLTAPGGVRAALTYADPPSLPVGRARGHGELAAWHLVSTDRASSAAFLGELFGWDAGADVPGDGIGAGDGPEPPRLVTEDPAAGSFTFWVGDLAEALATVRRLGGTAAEPVDGTATAADDQGFPFTLRQLA